MILLGSEVVVISLEDAEKILKAAVTGGEGRKRSERLQKMGVYEAVNELSRAVRRAEPEED